MFSTSLFLLARPVGTSANYIHTTSNEHTHIEHHEKQTRTLIDYLYICVVVLLPSLLGAFLCCFLGCVWTRIEWHIQCWHVRHKFTRPFGGKQYSGSSHANLNISRKSTLTIHTHLFSTRAKTLSKGGQQERRTGYRTKKAKIQKLQRIVDYMPNNAYVFEPKRVIASLKASQILNVSISDMRVFFPFTLVRTHSLVSEP